MLVFSGIVLTPADNGGRVREMRTGITIMDDAFMGGSPARAGYSGAAHTRPSLSNPRSARAGGLFVYSRTSHPGRGLRCPRCDPRQFVLVRPVVGIEATGSDPAGHDHRVASAM